MNIDVPSETEIFRIASITMRGWKLEYEGWKKEGVLRELKHHEKESNDFASRHNQSWRFDGTYHSLEEAFSYEEGKEDA